MLRKRQKEEEEEDGIEKKWENFFFVIRNMNKMKRKRKGMWLKIRYYSTEMRRRCKVECIMWLLWVHSLARLFDKICFRWYIQSHHFNRSNKIHIFTPFVWEFLIFFSFLCCIIINKSSLALSILSWFSPTYQKVSRASQSTSVSR